MILQALANDVCSIILSPEDTFREILDEVEVFAPCRENVLLADLSTYLVRIVVAHEAEIRIYRGTDFLKESEPFSMCLGTIVKLLHGGDEVAACTVRDINATGIEETRARAEMSHEEPPEFVRHDVVMIEATHDPFTEVLDVIEGRRPIARWFDDRADEFCAFGVVLEVDFIGVESDVQLLVKKFANFLDEPPAVVGRADKELEIIDEDDEAIDLFHENHPHGEHSAEEVGPNLVRQIANFEAVHVKKAFARWKVSPKSLGGFSEEVISTGVRERGFHHIEEGRFIVALVLVHDDVLKILPEQFLVNRHEEIGEIASNDVAVLASIAFRVVIDHFFERKDSTEGAITFAAVHRAVANSHKVVFKDRAETQVLPMVRYAVAEGSSPNLAENRVEYEETHRSALCVGTRAHLFPQLHEITGGVPTKFGA